MTDKTNNLIIIDFWFKLVIFRVYLNTFYYGAQVLQKIFYLKFKENIFQNCFLLYILFCYQFFYVIFQIKYIKHAVKIADLEKYPFPLKSHRRYLWKRFDSNFKLTKEIQFQICKCCTQIQVIYWSIQKALGKFV